MTGRYTRNLSLARRRKDCSLTSDEKLATHRAQLGEVNNLIKIQQHTKILMFSLILKKFKSGINSLMPALKGQCHDFRFFHEPVSPKPLSILLGPFGFFRKFAEIFAAQGK
jgi:hypothetical protein